MSNTFKTLQFKDEAFGRFAIIIEDEIGECGTPTIYPISCTMNGLQQQLPKVNFKDVKLIIVKISELQTNSV